MVTMSVTWKDGAAAVMLEPGTLTTKAQVLALSAELRKLAKLLPDRVRRSKTKAKSSRQTASPRRKAKASGSDIAGSAATAQA